MSWRSRVATAGVLVACIAGAPLVLAQCAASCLTHGDVAASVPSCHHAPANQPRIGSAPNIALILNGFSITGPNDAAAGCKGANVGTESGISTNGQANVGIRGPGVVQRFQGDGILFNATVKGWVQGVTTSTNCMSGIRIGPTSTSISVESNVAVRNGTPAAACGGI